MKRPPLPYLLLLPLLAVLLFGNCGLLEKVLTQRTVYELLGEDLKPQQVTQLRAALYLAQQQRLEIHQRYSHPSAKRRAELQRVEAGTQAQLLTFLTPRQRRLLRRHRAKVERRLGVAPSGIGPH